MASGKWIGGFLGFITGGGPLGFLAGFALGWLFDQSLDTSEGSRSDHNEAYNRRHSYEGERNSFLFSMLVLASYVIKADGKIMHSEMEFVRRFLRDNFGNQAEEQGEDILLKLFEQQKQMGPELFRMTINDVCRQIAQNMEYSQRLQLLNFLMLIAKADGTVAREEIMAIKEIAIHLKMSAEDVDSMLNMGYGRNSLEDAYKILGIVPEATNDEVKAAYRRMALKHHPDRVASLGEDVKKAAEKKFQEINNAKEAIYKARGL